MKTTGSTKLVGIIGYPLGHSISPQMHNAAFEKLGLDYDYIPFEVKPENLKKAIDGMRAEGIIGFNVTIPHKETIIPLLDEVTKLPKIIGAVNTVKNENGKLVGYNTDAVGFLESLKLDAGVDPKDKNIVLIGAGGAAKAVAVMLAEAKAKSIVITDIDLKKSEILATHAGSYFDSEIKSLNINNSDFEQAISRADIVINATPIGMHPKEGLSPLKEEIILKEGSTVFDLIYNPPETKLMRMAKRNNAKAFNGLGMLVRQGALAFNIWTGEEAPVDIMWQAAKQALKMS